MGTRRIRTLAALGLAGLALSVTAALAAGTATPGVTNKQVVIGGTFPLTGPAALYSVIPKAENAYYQYVNARGGVNKRKISFKVLDDQYNPANTVPLTHKLVEQTKVFAVVNSLGTAPNLATRKYLNAQKVPQVLLATGDSYWGTQAKQYPWTIGWQPDYPGEAKIYGQYIHKNLQSAKIGVLMQDDSYGRNYNAGLVAGLGASRSNIVDTETYDATQTDVSSQVVKLARSGASVFVIFALPTQTIGALVVKTKIGWNAQTFVNNVSASPLFMLTAAKNGANVDGAITTTYLADTVNNPNSASAKLYKSILAKYDPGADPLDANNLYGVSVGWAFAYALKQAGKNPTRAGLMRALTHMKNVKNPFLYPGILENTSATDHFPIEQQILERWSNGRFNPFGQLYDHAR